MNKSRPILLVFSVLVMVFVLVGGVVAKVGAGESSSKQAVLFSEILSLVEDNYVDPVDRADLIEGAFEGMLGGLDSNGAFLTPEEVVAWKAGDEANAGPGLTVLKSARSFQVVAVDEGSSAEDAGIRIGDHLRSIDDVLVRDLSLMQVRRLLAGEKGSIVRLEILHPDSAYERESVDLPRDTAHGPAYRLEAQDGVAVLRILRLSGLDFEGLRQELDHLAPRGDDPVLLVDLRNLADAGPREAARLAGLFEGGPLLRLRDRSGRLLESVDGAGGTVWPGRITALVNGATAGAAEAVARLIQELPDGEIFGQSTYGLGSEARLYEMDNGTGLLVSAALWETARGGSWNEEGLSPDVEIEGEGHDYAEVSANQLERAIERLASGSDEIAASPEAGV